ncbi:MAG: 2,3-bisphosphoglycerate-independent phosphoglycerate mutase [Chitinophagaceae bacterium]|nr:MAG: 2,3-bisphosphoglycerate-independent phosphoglycerate mutase [Chitinophagaceae bacterium]
MESKKTMLIIMDGWGLGQVPSSDAIRHAHTPFVSSLYATFPNSTLVTCGEPVGLPAGQMGNSEVGHLNLGAGRIVYQELERINVAIRNRSFHENPVLLEAIRYAKDNNKALHLMGLVSDGGVHSHTNHLKAITEMCAANGLTNVLIHAFTDGRDTDPKSGLGYLTDLQGHLGRTTGAIASITGRYYGMDRDRRWERIRKAYDALVHGIGEKATDMLAAVEASYANAVTDEFILPIINQNLLKTTITDDDAVICFNFRTDRCREITEVLTQVECPEQDMTPLRLHYTTMTKYDEDYKNIKVVFEKDNLDQTLGEVLSLHGKTQLRIAETEKYPHVSFFFSGGREQRFPGEERIMIPSPKVATYDLQPEMSAKGVTDAAIDFIHQHKPDFVCLNFANADMVGHTGVWEAVIKAVETVDGCVESMVKTALAEDYCVFLTADHGNADYEINEDGSPNTAHTLNLVPLFIIDNEWRGTVKPGKLGDIAPSILKMMGLTIPPAMTGDLLF